MENREEIIAEYATRLYLGMDEQDLEEFVVTTIMRELADYTDEQLITEVRDYFPDLFED